MAVAFGSPSGMPVPSWLRIAPPIHHQSRHSLRFRGQCTPQEPLVKAMHKSEMVFFSRDTVWSGNSCAPQRYGHFLGFGPTENVHPHPPEAPVSHISTTANQQSATPNARGVIGNNCHHNTIRFCHCQRSRTNDFRLMIRRTPAHQFLEGPRGPASGPPGPTAAPYWMGVQP